MAVATGGTSVLPALAVASLLLLGACVTTQDGGTGGGTSEKISFQSDAPNARTEVSGLLRFPAEVTTTSGTPSKFPAVILVHGSGGVQWYREHRYAKAIVAIGAAALVLDSFAPRGVDNTLYDQTKVTTFDMMADAHGALAALARHPRIDPDRIAIVGFSKGGTVALYAALETVARRYAQSPARFHAHVPFYPGCDFRYADWTPAGGDVLLLLGAADTYTGVGPCLDVAAALQRAGGNIATTIYPDAGHSWDSQRSFRLSSGQNVKDCIVDETPDGTWMARHSGQVAIGADGRLSPQAASVLKGCARSGIEGGLHEATKRQSMDDLLAFLRKQFGLAAPAS